VIARTAALALLLGLAGCRLPPQPRPGPFEGEWAAARDGATRAGKLYDGLSTNAFIRAIYQPRSVRDARVARVAAWKALSVDETERLLVAERDDAARHEEFLVLLFTPDLTANDLDARNSVWRLALVVQGAPDVLPEHIEQVRADSMLRTLYPAIGDFDVVYRVRFPRQQELAGKAFVLRLAGAQGRLDLQY
jgi:hypothetical protein